MDFFSNLIGVVSLHPSKGMQWVAYMNENYFDSYGCFPPHNLSKSITKRKGKCLCCDYKIQCLTSKRDSYCASHCFYIIYLTKVIGIIC